MYPVCSAVHSKNCATPYVWSLRRFSEMLTYFKDHYTDIATVQQIKPGNAVCGDGHMVIQKGTYTVCAVVDGLGSGQGAYHSTITALEAVQTYHAESVDVILEHCNRALTHQRGAVMTVIKIDYKSNILHYANFGNIGFVLFHPDGSFIQPMPTRGYLCGRKSQIKSDKFLYSPGSAFMIYTDGVDQLPPKQALIDQSGLYNVSENVVAAKRFNQKDDATLMVGKFRVPAAVQRG
ncbi:hypothetical protein CHH59_11810 [Shouchella clausii]|nr:hypothetical protein CHH59_11810 [Shouchella clausii]